MLLNFKHNVILLFTKHPVKYQWVELINYALNQHCILTHGLCSTSSQGKDRGLTREPPMFCGCLKDGQQEREDWDMHEHRSSVSELHVTAASVPWNWQSSRVSCTWSPFYRLPEFSDELERKQQCKNLQRPWCLQNFQFQFKKKSKEVTLVRVHVGIPKNEQEDTLQKLLQPRIQLNAVFWQQWRT